MPRSRKVSGKMTIEITVDIQGVFWPSTPDTRDDPGDPAFVEDITATYKGMTIDLTDEDVAEASEILAMEAVGDDQDYDEIDEY